MKKFANDHELFEYFSNMAPMKYYENNLDLPKAQEMLSNKNNDFFAMRKYDGEWARAIILKDSVLIQSRSISKITGTYGNKTELVPHIVSELQHFFPPGTVLLGELAFNDYTSTSREVGSVLRCKPEKAIARQKEKPLHFFVFDVLAYNGVDLTNLPFSKRFMPEYTVRPEAKYIDAPLNTSGIAANFMDFADFIWQKGGEGVMIVRNDMKYSPGSRTAWQTLKVKKKLGNIELKVIGVIEPNKNYEGNDPSGSWMFWVDANDKRLTKTDLLNMRNLGRIMPVTKPYYNNWKNGVIVSLNGNPVSVTSGLTDHMREYLARPETLEDIKNGKVFAIISGMEKTEKSIRHPIFIDLVQ